MKRETIDKIKQFKGLKVLVVGDIMADVYLEGKVERICPEAPVPILNVYNHRYDLGGAANVAKYLSCLGADVSLYGNLGQDVAADKLQSEMKFHNIRYIGTTEADYITTTKNRALNDHNHQIMFRWDYEMKNYQPSEFDQQKLSKEIKAADVVVISDYSKGSVTGKLSQFIIKNHDKVVVDPKEPDWWKFSGAYIIKPNKKEFERFKASCEYTSDWYTATALKTNLIVTQGGEGMFLARKKKRGIEFVETEEESVIDVTGAGDMVTAIFALTSALDMDIIESMKLANYVASLKIKKQGTTPVYLHELEDHLYDKEIHDRIFYGSDDPEMLEKLVRRDISTVFTNGCFDLIHDGHVELLKQAKSKGDALVVGLNSDASVKRLKGDSRPVQNEKARANVLASIKYVDAVVIFNEDTPEKLIENLTPEVLIKGADYDIKDIVGYDHVVKHGGRVETIEFIEGSSTSSIIEKIQSS